MKIPSQDSLKRSYHSIQRGIKIEPGNSKRQRTASEEEPTTLLIDEADNLDDEEQQVGVTSNADIEDKQPKNSGDAKAELTAKAVKADNIKVPV